MSVLVTIAVVLLLLFTTAFVYDRMTRLKRAVQKTWRELEQHRRRRHAVVERLEGACSGQTADVRTLEAVMIARRSAAAAAGPPDAARHEAILGEALGALLTTSTITMSAQVAALAREFGEVDEGYRRVRHTYNDTARRYNVVIRVVPGSLIARLGNFPRAELFEIADP